MDIRYSKQARKYLKKLHKPKREKIIEVINEMPQKDIEKVEGTKDLLRLKINDYRVIFNKDGDIIFIQKVGSRGDVYKWL